MSLQSPLAKVLGSGSAKGGTDHWWAQRLTAVALLILGLWFLVSVSMLGESTHADLHAWARRPFNSVMLLLFALTLTWHSALGIQVVIEDYVHGPFSKVISLIFNKFAHVFLAFAATFAILKIAFGDAA
jgi:succinate dehydrogenase / fumarate reductase membrane anchor subunit